MSRNSFSKKKNYFTSITTIVPRFIEHSLYNKLYFSIKSKRENLFFTGSYCRMAPGDYSHYRIVNKGGNVQGILKNSNHFAQQSKRLNKEKKIKYKERSHATLILARRVTGTPELTVFRLHTHVCIHAHIHTRERTHAHVVSCISSGTVLKEERFSSSGVVIVSRRATRDR